MHALTNPVKAYAWGSLDAIPLLLGTEPTGEPQAELWIGTHPSGSSVLSADGRSLRDVIATPLPFLMKILSAAAPLSLQVHPSKAQAESGYAAEDAAGLALDAPTRNYKDANHKPELLYALTQFEALCGFAPPAQSVDLLRRIRSETSLGAGVLDDLIDDLADPDESAALRRATERLLTLDTAAAAALVPAVTTACRGIDEPGARTAVDLALHYPGDAGVVLSLLLNRVSLAPGQAIFLPAGNMHAYLRGTGVEVMAASDNVLRGGLTPKHIDVPELLAIVQFAAIAPTPITPIEPVAGQLDFVLPVEDFGLSILSLSPGRSFRWEERVPRTVFVLDGEVTLTSGSRTLALARGASAFLPAADAPIEVAGEGRLAVAAPGH